MQVLVVCLALCVFLRGSSSHDDDHDDHEDHDHEVANCPITAHSFASTYLNNVEAMGIVDPQTGQPCSLPYESNSHYDLGDDFEDYEVCETLFYFSQKLILDLNATDECCLFNMSDCHNATDTPPAQTVDRAKAFGYGTLMVSILSLLSLIGVLVLPLLKENSKIGRYYQHFNLFMISLGASALFCDAVMHILPHALGFDDHNHGSDDDGAHSHVSGAHDDDDHSHDNSGYGDLMLVWRTCAVMGGMYFFYVMEYILNWLTGGHHHSHGYQQNDPSQPLLSVKKTASSSTDDTQSSSDQIAQTAIFSRCCMRPLAVLIVCGDAIHNFTDGIALGASISDSLALGISTAIAVTFHEIPHELGNFAILLSTGMKWQYVLLVNFFSSLTAFVGFYIGVGVGLTSDEANSWLLAVAAGTFLYVALVDLLPLIMASEVKGFTGFLISNIGFFISFNILLLVAVFEEKLDSAFTDKFT